MAPFESIFGPHLPKYKYKPIPAGSRLFRLATLLPPEPSRIPGREPTVRISLSECEAGSETTGPSLVYDALSYAWQVPPNAKRPDRRIIVECASTGGRFSMAVFRPLEVALLCFCAANARNDGAGYRLPIFIDQLCVDQESDAEKAQQVPLMQAIYTHCRRAVIWLGAATAETDLWFSYVRGLAAEGMLSGMMGPRVGSIMRVFDAALDPTITLTDPEELLDLADMKHLIEKYAESYPIAAYLAVLRRPWFHRLWTVQEACLAPALAFVCGAEQLCYDCVRAGSFFHNVQNGHWIARAQSTSKSEMALRSAALSAADGLLRIAVERKAIHRQGRRLPMHELLLKYNVLSDNGARVGASLAQDRIYGLLGLTAADDPIKAAVGIYYDKENQEVAQRRAYAEIAALLLRQGRFDMLLFNQTSKITAGLPSWAPDWAMEMTLPVGWMALQQPAHSAGGDADTASIQVDELEGKLTVRGVLVGHVTAVGERTYTTQTPPQIVEQIEYTDAKLMFDEIDAFIAAAPPRTDNTAGTADDTVRHLRIYDSGLSMRHFTTQLSSAALAAQRIHELHASISSLGARLLRAAATARAYSLANIYRTVGITPWYLDYYRATSVLRSLARGPVRLAHTFILAAADAVEDLVGMCLASARMALATWTIALRRRFGRTVRRHTPAEMEAVGLRPEVVAGPDMLAFLTNLLRNVGRRVYRLGEGGYVGMGPRGMQEGDAVVVVKGMTSPLVLRRVAGGAGEEWAVVGEAYCDGVMDGEALGGNEREFVLV